MICVVAYGMAEFCNNYNLIGVTMMSHFAGWLSQKLNFVAHSFTFMSSSQSATDMLILFYLYFDRNQFVMHVFAQCWIVNYASWRELHHIARRLFQLYANGVLLEWLRGDRQSTSFRRRQRDLSVFSIFGQLVSVSPIDLLTAFHAQGSKFCFKKHGVFEVQNCFPMRGWLSLWQKSCSFYVPLGLSCAPQFLLPSSTAFQLIKENSVSLFFSYSPFRKGLAPGNRLLTN